MGQRNKDIKNGLSAPPRIKSISTLIDLALKPAWCFEMLKTKRRSFRNVVGHVDGVVAQQTGVDVIGSPAERIAAQEPRVVAAARCDSCVVGIGEVPRVVRAVQTGRSRLCEIPKR